MSEFVCLRGEEQTFMMSCRPSVVGDELIQKIEKKDSEN